MKEKLGFLVSIGAVSPGYLKTCSIMQAYLHINILRCTMLLGLLMLRCKLSS